MRHILDGLTPEDLQLPAKFTEFRQIQRELVDWALYGPGGDGLVRRFMCAGVPAGGGKSLGAHAIGKMLGLKYAVLTATRTLEQQQVDDDFPVVNVRGRANYECRAVREDGESKWNCEEGQDHDCPYAGKPDCTYTERALEAKSGPGVLTNYAYWMSVRARNQGALQTEDNPIELLILDEAHKAMVCLAQFLGVWISSNDLRKYGGEKAKEVTGRSMGREWGYLGEEWTDALTATWGALDRARQEIGSSYRSQGEAAARSKEYRRLEKLGGAIGRLVGHVEDDGERDGGKWQGDPGFEETEGGGSRNWIWKETERGWAFECVWPAPYAEKYLWSGVGKVILLSATLRPKAAQLLGIKQEQRYFQEWPRVFPPQNCPVYWVPTGKMGSGSKDKEGDWRKAVQRANEIYQVWSPRFKGIVHTPSYKLAEQLQGATEFGRWMMINPRGDSAATAKRFREAKAPAILVSPSYGTGFDFPSEQCEWIHIPKLPFPDRSDPVVVARSETDDQWYDYETAQSFYQRCYRGQRHPTDKCTVIVTDDAVRGFRYYARQHFPRHFKVLDSATVPKPKG